MKKDPQTTAAALPPYFRARTPESWHLIDGVNLVIHEAGHLIFDFLRVSDDRCGSLFQVIMPGLFVGYFVTNGSLLAALVLLWVGERF
jgi:cytochrome c oxidase subunit IV